MAGLVPATHAVPLHHALGDDDALGASGRIASSNMFALRGLRQPNSVDGRDVPGHDDLRPHIIIPPMAPPVVGAAPAAPTPCTGNWTATGPACSNVNVAVTFSPLTSGFVRWVNMT